MRFRYALLIVVALVLALTGPACGQALQPSWGESPWAAWAPEHRPLAEALSNVGVYSAVAIDTVHSFKAAHKSRAFVMQGCRMAIAVGATEIVKRAVRRERPDRSDAKSFYSMHTAVARGSPGWGWKVDIPLAALTGVGRAGAGRHYVSDVLIGFGVGALASLACPAE